MGDIHSVWAKLEIIVRKLKEKLPGMYCIVRTYCTHRTAMIDYHIVIFTVLCRLYISIMQCII